MASNRKFPVGQGIQYDFELRDPTILVTPSTPDANLVDPSGGVTLSLSGAGLSAPLVFTYLTDLELVRVSLGKYRMIRVHDTAGELRWRWQSTGDYSGVEQGADTILESNT